MSKSKMRLAWVAVNGFWWTTAVLGAFYGHEWAANVFKFLAVIFLVMNGVAAFIVTLMVATDNAESGDLPDGPSVPLGVRHSVDLAGATMVAAVGWFLFATIVVAQMCCEAWVWWAIRHGRQKAESDDRAEDGAPERAVRADD